MPAPRSTAWASRWRRRWSRRRCSGRSAESLQIRLAKYLAKRLVRRYAGRLVPFIGAPLGALQNGGVTKDVGKLALTYYARP